MILILRPTKKLLTLLLLFTLFTSSTIYGQTSPQSPTILGPETITKNSNYILSSRFFLNYFTAVDYESNDITSNIIVHNNEYAGNANKPGTYEITLSVEDNQQNSTFKTFTINVNRQIDPYYIVGDNHFVLPKDKPLSQSMITSNLKSLNLIPNDTYLIDMLFDNYTNNEDQPGTYYQSFYLTSESGEDYYFYLTFDVNDTENQIIIENTTFIDTFTSFLKSWWWLSFIPVLIIIGIIKKS